jgi:hypothetical protein
VAYRILEDEAGAAHELLPHLLAAAVGEVVPRDGEALTVRHAVPDLVHLPVHRPPLRLLRGRAQARRRRLDFQILPHKLISHSAIRSSCSNFIKYQIKFPPNFIRFQNLEVSLNCNSESEEDPIRKVVPYFSTFAIIFSLNFFEFVKALF